VAEKETSETKTEQTSSDAALKDKFEQGGVGGPIGRMLGGGLVGGPIGKSIGIGGPIGGMIGEGAPPSFKAGLLGLTGGAAPKKDPPTPRERAQRAINEAQPPPADHPYRQHVEGVHAQLQSENLPTDASGVRVKVVGDGPGHGEMVARAVGGKGSGIAPGADLSIQDQLGHDVRPPGFELNAREESFFQGPRDFAGEILEGKDVSLSEMTDFGARAQVGSVHDKRQELAQVRADQPDDGKLTIANMSWGVSPARSAEGLANSALLAREGTPLHGELTKLLGHPPTDADRKTLTTHFAKEIQGKLDGEYKGDLNSARGKLSDELKDARGENILFVVAAGNEGDTARDIGDMGASRTPVAGVDGLVIVGSTTLDQKVSGFSNRGATISAPGDDVPLDVGHRRPGSLFGKIEGALGGNPLGGPLGGARPVRDTDGTSFAAPYVAGVAALMSKANPNLNANQIANLLHDPRALTNIAGTTRDGGGMIDPVRAVQLAANAK
jgi:subtilisin family serine protease